ncbi:MAG: hypothetical protein JW940_23835 [Polyangiaceae bacterium]|nr:hypothetical protein [Polyangiaceae bacterium]
MDRRRVGGSRRALGSRACWRRPSLWLHLTLLLWACPSQAGSTGSSAGTSWRALYEVSSDLPAYGIDSVLLYVQGSNLDPDGPEEEASQAATDENRRSRRTPGVWQQLGVGSDQPEDIDWGEWSPGLTSPEFPLTPRGDRLAESLEAVVFAQTKAALVAKGYRVSDGQSLRPGTVGDLLQNAVGSGVRGVLLVRLYVIYPKAHHPLAPEGPTVLPGIELYDAASGTRVYHSVGHYAKERPSEFSDLNIQNLSIGGPLEGQALANVAMTYRRTILEGRAGIPPASPAAQRIEDQVESDASGRAVANLTWSDKPWHSWQIDSLILGYEHLFVPASGPTYQQGSGNTTSQESFQTPLFSVTAVSLETRHLSFPMLGLGFGLPVDKGTVGTEAPRRESVMPVLIDVVGARYLLRATDRIGVFVGGALSAMLITIGNDDMQSWGMWAASGGLRLETLIPVDLFVRYHTGSRAVGVGVSLYTFGAGRRPYYDRVRGMSVW